MDRKDRMAPFRDNHTYKKLNGEERDFISRISDQYQLTFQDIKMLIDISRDLSIWDEGNLSGLWNIPDDENLKGKQLKQHLMNNVKDRWEQLKKGLNDYSKFSGRTDSSGKTNFVRLNDESTILGSCPVASEKTRCCNLKTLDVVLNCGFDCTYCSIQSFFDNDRVYFHENLEEKLRKLNLDPAKRYHIGTGQSSDSLMWGNREGILDKLNSFAGENRNVILELKTKSRNIAWLLENDVAPNIFATWSLNTPAIAGNEEHFAASPEQRLESARKVADKGIPVGFHFHPIVHYKGWEDDYKSLTTSIQNMFSPEEVALLSMGTLTYIKPVIRKIRDREMKSKILEMPMIDAGGKLSYPIEIKRELFGTVYNSFSEDWKKEVFFYLCMEDQSLWEPLFGRSYRNNEEFENDMIESYFRKVPL
ncbi:SPL family radical SAM protein [Spirochaeta isovalerica]|uniref:Spore photoproduct lyase n=1 Tax=Spirochaeta isovalerica TaxID=150 RepID=A0A841RIT7_9SPIO|nr:radical SAM protein [Spirochaeta isovalerica]MBB6482639.1 spore photoproduct lyase [Spirochaeta isovalerica]